MYEIAAFVFWLTLILYLITLFVVSYVGVYLTYIAIPVIVIFGLIMKYSNPKKETQEAITSTKDFIKESGKAASSVLDKTNNALNSLSKSFEILNEKSALIRNRTENLREYKNKLKLEKVESEIEFKYASDEESKKKFENEIKEIDDQIRITDEKINQIKKECELEITQRYQTNE